MIGAKRCLAALTAAVLLLALCAAALADGGKPGEYEINFYARKNGKLLYTWKTGKDGKLTKDLRSVYRDGYVFMGWYTHPYRGTRITQDTVFTEETNLWAHWGTVEGQVKEEPKPGVYTVSFLEDDNSRTLPSAARTDSEGHLANLPEPTVEKKRDLKFLGWRDRGTLRKITADSVFTGTATLQAVWGSDSRANLIYMSDGRLLSVRSYAVGKWVTSFEGKPDTGAAGRKFLGWYTEETEGEQVSRLLMTEDRILYARWSEPGYTVTFTDAYAFEKDGTRIQSNRLRTHADGTLGALPEGISGSGLFTGWYLDKQRTVPLTEDTVFQKDSRVWAKVERAPGAKVRLDLRTFGTYYVRVTPDTVPAGEDGTLAVLPTPAWMNNGQERKLFRGWFTEQDEPVTAATVFTENATIYAKWVEGYRISFSSAGSPSFRAAYTDENGRLTELPAIGRAPGGNPALGWYTAEGEKVTTDTVFTADTELVPKWGYTVRFYTENRGNGWGYGDVAALTTGEDGRLPYLPRASHPKAYPFAGWTDENGNPVTEETAFTADASVYGTWETEGKVIQLMGSRGGSPDVSSVRTRNDGTVAELPQAHQKNGLAFRGWSLTEDGNTPVTAETVFTDNYTRLYAAWIPAYKVTFRPQGGATLDGTQAVMTDETGHVAEWPEAEHPLKLRFEGWYTSPRPTAEKEGPESVFTKDTWVDARWSVPQVPADGFTVTLTDREDSREVKTTATGKLQGLSGLRRTDAVFYGWFTEPAAGGQKVRNGTQIGADMTFYAAWLIPLTEAEDR